MTSGPITSPQIDGKITETVTDVIFLGSQITTDGDYSHEIKRCLLLGRKAMTNLKVNVKGKSLSCIRLFATQPRQHIKKQRHSSADKGPFSQSYGFSSSIHGFDSWNTRKAECLRIDAFELWRCRRLLRVPWTARRSKQSILKEISLEYSLERMMLKLQYFGYLM